MLQQRSSRALSTQTLCRDKAAFRPAVPLGGAQLDKDGRRLEIRDGDDSHLTDAYKKRVTYIYGATLLVSIAALLLTAREMRQSGTRHKDTLAEQQAMMRAHQERLQQMRSEKDRQEADQLMQQRLAMLDVTGQKLPITQTKSS